MFYYDTKGAATKDIARREKERKEHGVQLVTADDRTWISFLKERLDDDLSQLPEIIEHWRNTGAGAVQPTTVKDAVAAFQAQHLPNVKERTQSDVRHRLKKFAGAFDGREMHSIHAGEVEKWLHTYSNAWTRRSYWKRIAPLFDWCVRHRVIAENPLELLQAPKTKRTAPKVYTPEQFVKMFEWSQKHSWGRYAPIPGSLWLVFCPNR